MNKKEAKLKYRELILKCVRDEYNCEGDYYEIHHIRPKSKGGSNEPCNLIKLKYVDHIFAHYYLAIIYNDAQMLGAFNIMTGNDRLNKILPEEQELVKSLPEYEELKVKYIDLVSKPVYQYDLNGNFIAEFPSTIKAGELNHIRSNNIIRCACGYIKRANGYIWSYVKSDKVEVNFKLQKKHVYQYDLNGKFIAEFNSITDASKQTGVVKGNISKVCNLQRETAGGFIWKIDRQNTYSESRARKDPKKVKQYSLDGKFIAEYNSMTEAAKCTGVSYGSICAMINGGLKTAGGFIWEFVEINNNYVISTGKPVNMYDLSGKYLKTFASAGLAKKETGVSVGAICANCNGESKRAGNYQWRWESEFLNRANIGEYVPYVKNVYQYDLNGNFIAKYENAADVKRKTGIIVHAVLQGKRKTAGGFIWKCN